MDAATLKRLEEVYNAINLKKEADNKVKVVLSKERKAKLYGNQGVTVFHTESGKLGAVLPIGMSAVKLGTVCEKCKEQIEEFKTSNEQLLKI
mgnify:CR=1 FL=1